MKIVSVCLLFILLVFSLSFKIAFAQSLSNPKTISGGQVDEALLKTVPIRFLPDNPLYFLITFKEAIARFFQPSSAKRAEFDFILGGKRLKESYLLLEKGYLEKASNNLLRYRSRNLLTISQLDKARSQNQDLGKIVSTIAEDLKYHEVFLLSMREGGGTNLPNLNTAIGSFSELVIAIDKFKPGFKDRYKNFVNTAQNEQNDKPSPSPTFEPIILESTPTASPRRIIY